MAKRMTIMLIILIIIFGLLIGWRLFVNAQIKKYFTQPQPAVAVETMIAKAAPWQPYLDSVGSLIAQQSVNITTQIAGIVSVIHFKSGDTVAAGAPLVDLKDGAETAALASDQAKLTLAAANYDRAKRLYAKHVFSTADYQTNFANYQEAKAALQSDQVNIDNKHIVAPFAGKLGINQINLGEYITPGTTTIVNLQKLDPIDVEFSLPQQAISQIKVGQAVVFTVDSYPGKEFKGTVIATNAGFDATSRMLLLRATLPNPQHELYGGMYGDIKVLLPAQANVISIPQTAVTYNLYGTTVYIIKKEGDRAIAKQAFVQVGQDRGDDAVITKGVKVGDEVVTSGQIKLYDGAPVIIKNNVFSAGANN